MSRHTTPASESPQEETPRPGKRCSRCKEWKPPDAFHSSRSTKDGKTPMCKACNCADASAWRMAHREVSREAQRVRRGQRKAAGLCWCGEPLVAGRRKCRGCTARTQRRHQALREEVLSHYGRVCACCGETMRAGLEIDHIDGTGAQDRRAGKRGYTFYGWLKERGFPPGFQTLCKTCNSAKGTGTECPHRRERQEMLRVVARLPLCY